MFNLYFKNIYLKKPFRTIISFIVQIIFVGLYFYFRYIALKPGGIAPPRGVLDQDLTFKSIWITSFIHNFIIYFVILLPFSLFLFRTLEQIRIGEENGMDSFFISYSKNINRRKLFWKKLKIIFLFLLPLIIFNFSIIFTILFFEMTLNKNLTFGNGFFLFATNFFILPLFFIFPLLLVLIILNKLFNIGYFILKTILSFSLIIWLITLFISNLLPLRNNFLVTFLNHLYDNLFYVSFIWIALNLLIICSTVMIFYKKSIITNLD